MRAPKLMLTVVVFVILASMAYIARSQVQMAAAQAAVDNGPSISNRIQIELAKTRKAFR